MTSKKRTLDRVTSKAAYALVDLSELHEETRKDIIADALEGGGTYGIRVVEEAINGAARAPLFGVYLDGPDAEKWANAKKELGLGVVELKEGERPGDIVETLDPRRETALREAAAQAANAQADKIRAGEAEAIAAIVGEENEATKAGSAADAPNNRRSGNKAPK